MRWQKTYTNQVNQLNKQLPEIECSTVHKFQGREKDHMIMIAVDDQITAFSDNPNLLNVAISRARKNFCIVVTGNEQNQKGNKHEDCYKIDKLVMSIGQY